MLLWLNQLRIETNCSDASTLRCTPWNEYIWIHIRYIPPAMQVIVKIDIKDTKLKTWTACCLTVTVLGEYPHVCVPQTCHLAYTEFVSWLGMYTYIYIYVHMSHVYNYISMYVQIYCIDKHYTWFSSGINSYRICVIYGTYTYMCYVQGVSKKWTKKTLRPSIEFPTMGWCIRIPFNLYSWASKGAAKQTPSRERKATPLEACEAR